MMGVSDCIAEFSAAALFGAPDASVRAERAMDAYLAPHAAFPLKSISMLYRLLDAFRDLKFGTRAAAAIEEQIVARILVIEQSTLLVAADGQNGVGAPAAT